MLDVKSETFVGLILSVNLQQKEHKEKQNNVTFWRSEAGLPIRTTSELSTDHRHSDKGSTVCN
jgi:hypothetical protein